MPDALSVLPLADRLAAEGAVMAVRDGVATAAHFGSVPGEEAVCLSRAGIAHRADLAVAGLSPEAAEELGCPPEPGQAIRRGGAWILRAPTEGALAVGPRAGIDALAAAPSSLVALSVIGPRAGRLVAAAGGPRLLGAGEVATWALGDQDGTLLREGSQQFLALVPPALAGEAWDRLTVAGRSVGASHVGLDAVRRLGAARLVAVA